MKNNMLELNMNEMNLVNGGYIRKTKDGGFEVVGDVCNEDARYFSKEAIEEAEKKLGQWQYAMIV
jgi:hypothetical protein